MNQLQIWSSFEAKKLEKILRVYFEIQRNGSKFFHLFDFGFCKKLFKDDEILLLEAGHHIKVRQI